MGDTAVVPPAPQPVAFNSFWAQWGDVIGGLSTVIFLLMALPGRNGKR